MSKSHDKAVHPHHSDILQSLLQSIFCLSVYLSGFCFLKWPQTQYVTKPSLELMILLPSPLKSHHTQPNQQFNTLKSID